MLSPLEPRCDTDLACQARRAVNYAESDDDDVEVFKPIDNDVRKGRSVKRRRLVVDDESDDEFELDAATEEALLQDGKFWIS